MAEFIRPAEYFKQEAQASFCRILSEIESQDMRRAVYSYTDKISILPPTVANETYLIFDNSEAKRRKLVDFSLAKTFSYVLHDWLVDGDLKSGQKEAQMTVKFMDELGSQRLASCSVPALEHFQNNANSFIDAMWEEQKLDANLDNYMRLLGKKSKIYNAMYGAAAIVGNAKKESLENVEKFGENLYMASQLTDDLKDFGNEKWNLVNFLGKDKVVQMKGDFQKNAISNIKQTKPSKHTDYLVKLVDFLYQ